MFKRWVFAKKAQDVENVKLKMADVHFGRQITRKCLAALLSHVENRRRKQRIRGEMFSLKKSVTNNNSGKVRFYA